MASRRLREVVPIAGLPGHDKLRRRTTRRIRRLTRALGPVRELDVTLDLLDKWPSGDDAAVAAALDVVRARVREAREAQRAALVAAIPPATAAEVFARLREPGERLIAAGQRAPAPSEPVAPWRVALARRVSRRAEALGLAIDAAGLLYEPERLHGVRIAAKKTRYVLEVTGDTRLAGTVRLVTALKRGQELLGDLHDLQVASGFVAAVRVCVDQRRPRRARCPARRKMSRAPCRVRPQSRATGARRRAHAPRRAAEAAPSCPRKRGRRQRPGTGRFPGRLSGATVMAEPITLYLIRHGVAEERGEKWPDDTLRPLTARGKARLRESATELLALDVRFDEIVTSPLVRARQTADVLANAFAEAPKVTSLTSLAGGNRVVDVIADLAKFAKRQHLALVGHEPGLGLIAARLVGSRHAIQFKKGAVCCIEVEALPPEGAGDLVWFATPKMLRSWSGQAAVVIDATATPRSPPAPSPPFGTTMMPSRM